MALPCSLMEEPGVGKGPWDEAVVHERELVAELVDAAAVDPGRRLTVEEIDQVLGL